MDNNNERRSRLPKGLLLFMAIFMVVLYVGMGVLFFIDFFGWVGQSGLLTTMNYICGTVLVLYGVYRGYRVVKGIGMPV